MALITCSECGNPMSSRAVACPRCGAPPDLNATPPVQPTTSTVGAGIKIGIGMFIVLPLLLFGGCLALLVALRGLSTTTTPAINTTDCTNGYGPFGLTLKQVTKAADGSYTGTFAYQSLTENLRRGDNAFYIGTVRDIQATYATVQALDGRSCAVSLR